MLLWDLDNTRAGGSMRLFSRKKSRTKNRRKDPRISFGRMLQYESDGRIFAATAEEISEGGLRLEATWKLPVASKLRLALPLQVKDGEVEYCIVKGRVVRRVPRFAGVQFEPMPADQRVQLKRFIRGG
jgi:hypothetical protein